MRRLLAVLVATAALLVGAGSASSGAIVCPLAHGAAVPVCCGPPVVQPDATPCCAANLPTAGPVCCPANAVCTVPLTISANPNPSAERDQVTISGRLLAGQAGMDVALWQELPGQTQFTTIAHAATDTMGNYTFTQAPVIDRRWYVTSGSQQSTTIDQWVGARVKVTATNVGRHGAGRIVELSGHVAPSHAGERVLIERLVAGQWKVLARARLGPASNYRIARLMPRGAIELRAFLPADSRNAESASRVVWT
jgi:hypothetical protein